MKTIARLAFFAFAFIFISYSTYISFKQNSEILLFTTQDKASTDSFQLSIYNPDYGQPEALDDYPWDFIVEPLRPTTIKIMDTSVSDGQVYWKFTRINKETDGETYYNDYGAFDSSIDIVEQGTTYLILKFQQAGVVFQMDMTQYTDSTKEETLRTASYLIASKFVRREVRQLTEADRSNFFDALELMHRLTMESGVALYGEKFRNSKHFALKHLDKFNIDRCTPYHGGDVFLTAHSAFTLSYERSLQSMFPELSFPYWDFTLDDVLYGLNWSTSPIFNDDWFSPLISSTQDENFPITKGRFAYIPVPFDYDAPAHNAYGRITSYFNIMKLPYTSRGNVMCDIKVTETNLPGCLILEDLLNKTTLDSFVSTLQDQYHTRLHAQLGGYWNCRHEWGAWTDTHSHNWNEIIRHISERLEIGYLQTDLNLTCPTYCDTDEKCSCECPYYSQLIKESHNKTYNEDIAYDLLKSWGVTSAVFGGSPGTRYVSFPCVKDEDNPECTKYNFFKDVPRGEQAEFWPWLLDQFCTPPTFSDYASPFGSAFDPLFMPLHHNIMRWWAYFRILAEDNSNYEYSWVDDDSCWAHKYTEKIGFGSKDIGYVLTNPEAPLYEEYFYTNQELDGYFHPFNPDLTYIFGSFDKSYCKK